MLALSVLDHSLIAPDSRDFKGATLWEFLDDYFPCSGIQTLVEVHREAKRLGLWAWVNRLHTVYAGSSWGFEFYGPTDALQDRMGHKDFCHDIDRFVRPEHGNTQHKWWRSLSRKNPVGSLHVGVSDGAPYHNMHFDTLNPAIGRLAFGLSETCNYSAVLVAAHNVDIHTDLALSAVSPFLFIESLNYVAKRPLEALRNSIALSSAAAAAPWQPVFQKFDDLTPIRSRLMDATTLISVLPDGYVRIKTEVAGELDTYQRGLNDALRAWTTAVEAQAARTAYFQNGTADARTDAKALADFHKKVNSSKGATSLSGFDMDRMIGFFDRLCSWSTTGANGQ